MRTSLRNIVAGALGGLAVAATVVGIAVAGQGDDVFYLSAHGDGVSGVARDAQKPVGSCLQCHQDPPGAAANPFGLFAGNDNQLCFTCHDTATARGIFEGPTAFLATDHWLSQVALWPGPQPAPRAPTEAGYCLNCHTPHGSRDALGLVPVLGYVREEALCLACHDASGPAGQNILAETNKANGHPVTAVSFVHSVDEGIVPASFAAGRRHAECVDCHNPHAARDGQPLVGVSRVAASFGAANSPPTYTARPPDDPAPVAQHEVCFKCHSGWTTLPAGARDLALELNPNNASFHPVVGAGTNSSSFMTQSLLGGTGTPHLDTTSTITCSDCHGSEALPTTVTTVASYVGTVPVGPHGSNAATSTALSPDILRGGYRVELKAASAAYARAEFQLCYICHSPAPFETTSKNSRSDTAFRFHGLHVSDLANTGSFDGDINTPGSGRGRAICAECHYSIHGTAGAYHAGNRTNARLVSFAPNVTGSSGSGEPSWTQGSCTLRCHDKGHTPKTY